MSPPGIDLFDTGPPPAAHRRGRKPRYVENLGGELRLLADFERDHHLANAYERIERCVRGSYAGRGRS
jgi:hypothetical protein